MRGRPALLLAGGCNRVQNAEDPADSGGDARESGPEKEGGAEESKVQDPGSIQGGETKGTGEAPIHISSAVNTLTSRILLKA